MDTNDISEFRPQDGDLVVVPEGTRVPDGLEFMVYSMKYLIKPSIIRSKAYGMSVLEMIKQSSLAKFFNVRDVVSHEPEKDSLDETTGAKVLNLKEELPMFFRYVRFKEHLVKSEENLGKFDKLQEVIAPRGGVAFLIELDAPNKTLAFSYALCHSTDNFCRKAARAICLNRLKHEDWYEIKDVNPSVGVVENIASALADMLYSKKPSYVKKNGATFSSVSDRMNEYELEELLKRIS